MNRRDAARGARRPSSRRWPTSCASEAIDSDEAADLVERCAELAARLGARDRRARAAAAGESEGQERLL